MIGVAIPLGLYVTSQTTLMSYSLFWATGFPGGISYISLFMNRNFLISQMTEKAINTWINVWIRAPGCISLAVLTLVYVSSNEKGNVIGLLPGLLMYWNGQYFMQQTVMDYAIRSVKHTEEEV
jgi:hypothetical protein